jgi:hypothetical protein
MVGDQDLLLYLWVHSISSIDYLKDFPFPVKLLCCFVKNQLTSLQKQSVFIITSLYQF